MEIPYLNEQDLKTVKMLLAEDPFVATCFENALGNGLVFIVKSSAPLSDHKVVYRTAVKYYQDLTGVCRFSSGGEEVDHTCMVSLDAYTHIAMNATPFPHHLRIVVAV